MTSQFTSPGLRAKISNTALALIPGASGPDGRFTIFTGFFTVSPLNLTVNRWHVSPTLCMVSVVLYATPTWSELPSAR